MLDSDEPANVAEAMAILCERYWRPVFAYCRAQGNSREDSEDAVQGFFTRMLNKNNFKFADQKQGRLRAFILTDLQFFLRDEWVKRSALKRGGGETPVSFDSLQADLHLSGSMVEGAPPDTVFDREWGFNLVEQAIERVSGEFDRRGKSELFESLKPLATPGESEGDYETIRDGLGLSPSRMSGAVFRLRKRLSEAIQETVSETVASDEELKQELHYLYEVLFPSAS